MDDPNAPWWNPSTWLPTMLAGCAGVYGLFRVLKRDQRTDRQVATIDDVTQRIIENLRAEVDRLTGRMEKMEREIVRLHEERALLLNKVAELESASEHNLTGRTHETT